jgi:Uma2 family endonuclease
VTLPSIQHLRLSNVPWEYYESTLAIIGNGATRVTYLCGEIEIMSPLLSHESWGWQIDRLLNLMALEQRVELEGLGSTTFRDKAKEAGLEPDKCYYVRNAAAAQKLEDAWNARTDPPPDLAIEIDITRRSIEREPIYATLKVQELWRFNGKTITIRHLGSDGLYQTRTQSEVFAFLPMDRFVEFVLKLGSGSQLTVLTEFRDWVRSL